MAEFADFTPLKEIIDWGCLPAIITDKQNRLETLATYVETYLRQELIEEGLIRKLEPFMRFLKIAGMYNSQVLNMENIAREAHIARSTIEKYFEILEDTLIGFKLPAVQLGLLNKEVVHAKFYFFDSGVARACAGLIYDEVDNVWRGFAFETYLLHELRAYNHYQKKNREFFYYRVSGGIEIDLLVELKKKTMSNPQEFLAFEFKYAKNWDPRWSKKLLELAQASKKKIERIIGIYLGDKILTQQTMTIYPATIFLKKLDAGEFF